MKLKQQKSINLRNANGFQVGTVLDQARSDNLGLAHGQQVVPEIAGFDLVKFPFRSQVGHVLLQYYLIVTHHKPIRN